nr:hypothetical protein [uncultured Flavobacterium sp.]
MREIFCEVEVIQTFDTLRNTMILKEESTSQEIIIGDIPAESILLKLDVDKAGYKKRTNYFNPTTQFIHKGCDYCLIIPTQLLIILFELKSEKPKKIDYLKQFIASEYFMDYCIKLSSYINNSESIYSYKRILLSKKYNVHYTNRTKLQDLSQSDVFGKTYVIKSPGFPHRIRLNKLIS